MNLTTKQRTAITYLAYGYRLKEISELMDYPFSALEGSLKRAKINTGMNSIGGLVGHAYRTNQIDTHVSHVHNY